MNIRNMNILIIPVFLVCDLLYFLSSHPVCPSNPLCALGELVSTLSLLLPLHRLLLATLLLLLLFQILLSLHERKKIKCPTTQAFSSEGDLTNLTTISLSNIQKSALRYRSAGALPTAI